MKLPRDVSGNDLAKRLRRYGYSVSRQTGSHIRLTSTFTGQKHSVTVPAHSPLKVGTLAAIMAEIAAYLELDRGEFVSRLFSR